MVGIGLITVVVWTVLIMLLDTNPSETCAVLFKGISGNLNGFMEVLVKTTPLIFTSLGCAVVLRADFFNIGAEGQFYIGVLASAQVTFAWTGIPGALCILCAISTGLVFDNLRALIATMFKTKLGISEIIVTIMLNYTAINLLGIAVRTSPMDPAGNIPQLPKPDPSATLYQFLKSTRLRAGFIIAMLMVSLVWFILEKTTVGYEAKMVGFNKRAAACDRISAVRNIIISALLDGSLAGVAGVVEIMGVQKELPEGISGGCGHTAVLIALLASNRPPGILFAATAFAALEVGANSMQRQVGVPSAIVDVPAGLIMPPIPGRELFYRKRKEEKPCQSGS